MYGNTYDSTTIISARGDDGEDSFRDATSHTIQATATEDYTTSFRGTPYAPRGMFPASTRYTLEDLTAPSTGNPTRSRRRITASRRSRSWSVVDATASTLSESNRRRWAIPASGFSGCAEGHLASRSRDEDAHDAPSHPYGAVSIGMGSATKNPQRAGSSDKSDSATSSRARTWT